MQKYQNVQNIPLCSYMNSVIGMALIHILIRLLMLNQHYKGAGENIFRNECRILNIKKINH